MYDDGFSAGEGAPDLGEDFAAPVVTLTDEQLGLAIDAIEVEDESVDEPAGSGEQLDEPDQQLDEPAGSGVESESERRPRGWLESDVESLLRKIGSGEVAAPLDSETQQPAPLTPHRVAVLLKTVESLDKAPSTGAVSAVFDRWVKIEAATFTRKPFAFAEFTPEAEANGVAAVKAAARAAAKAAADEPAA